MHFIKQTFICVTLLLWVGFIHAEGKLLKPFVLAATQKGDMTQIASEVKQKLTAAGFEIVGEYSPYKGANIIVITNDTLKKNAAMSERGTYGAAQRVSITQVNDEIQTSFTNPAYMAHAYRMKQDLTGVRETLSKALGDQGEYGPDEGLSGEDLREYHYKIFMPYFDDRLELASFSSYQEALKNVETALAASKGGVKKVYRIDLPGKEETVFGVNMLGPDSSSECSGDKYIMDSIDYKKVRSTGHLPYEMVVSGKNVYALYAEFRIAISFPDLSMIGSNSFASIMCAPSAIEEALTLGAGGKG